MGEATAGSSVQAESERRWYAGRNGGRLRPGDGSPGPRKATVLVRKALIEALRDPRGGSGKEFFVALKVGSAEDKRTFANIVTKLIPVEVAGELGGEMLKIVIATYVGTPGEVRHLPTQGTCAIGETGVRTPIAAPTAAKTEEVNE